jgi:hypothetical protein
MSNKIIINGYATTTNDDDLKTNINSKILPLTSNDDINTILKDQNGQYSIYNNVKSAKNTKFTNSYDLLTASDKEYKTNVEQMNNNETLQNVTDATTNNAKNITYEGDVEGRKYEMNEWTINNKKDTLFVFSMLFIVISGLLLITGLLRLNMISNTFWMALSVLLILIFIFTVVYRSQYTDVYRDKKYWNRKLFPGKYGNIPTTSVCLT